MRIAAIRTLVTLLIVGHALAAGPEARVTLRVVDENGAPIQGAEAGISVMVGTSRTHFATQIESSNATTDVNGEAELSISAPANLAYGAKKEGYYQTLGLEFRFDEVKMGRWQPWNPKLEVKLKKVKNPVAMYVRTVDLVLPKLDENIGFDLIKNDWVKPYGKGEVADFVFFVTKRVVNFSDFDATLRITFSNQGDGIQTFKVKLHRGSILLSDHAAPDGGYLGTLELRRAQTSAGRDNSGDMDLERNYYFRVRTRMEDGKAFSIYGKIYRDIEFAPINSPTAKIRFRYYLNPDGTRNVEFDPAKNLFGDIEEKKSIPDP